MADRPTGSADAAGDTLLLARVRLRRTGDERRTSARTSTPVGRLLRQQGAAAVDDETLAGDERSSVGDEEAHGVGDVVGCAHATGGDRGQVGIEDIARLSA